jgi:hypothetical protein
VTPDDEAVAEVIALERALLTREVRSSAAALDALLDPEFTETGASGRRWTRAEILAELPAGEAGAVPRARTGSRTTRWPAAGWPPTWSC